MKRLVLGGLLVLATVALGCEKKGTFDVTPGDGGQGKLSTDSVECSYRYIHENSNQAPREGEKKTVGVVYGDQFQEIDFEDRFSTIMVRFNAMNTDANNTGASKSIKYEIAFEDKALGHQASLETRATLGPMVLNIPIQDLKIKGENYVQVNVECSFLAPTPAEANAK